MKTNTWIKHILLLTFLLVLASQLKSQKLPEQDYNKLDQLLQKKFSEKFGLSILIAGDKKIIFNEAYGYIDTLKTKKVNQHFHLYLQFCDILAYVKGKINTEDGLRIDYPEFWLHVRPSNTEPVMRIIIEGREESLIQSVYSEIKEQL